MIRWFTTPRWSGVAAGVALAILLAGCATAPDIGLPGFDAAAAVAEIRAAGGANASELDVQPLRDPQVEDLREDAERLERERKYPEAAAALDQALQLNPSDPALLQDRAEAALLQQRLDDAERFARQGLEQGSKVGPLCRRHWETIAQVRLTRPASADTPGGSVADARRERDACTVAAPPRY
ncbi:tetratricopeptide repeat protein [Lysobacter cavernae]|uniref:Tetratricopeptide repeat protein n=1 Tax=Lysobacter cavernae TaxID=1685901 RepID=A0ABV7RUC1_9GAMM